MHKTVSFKARFDALELIRCPKTKSLPLLTESLLQTSDQQKNYSPSSVSESCDPGFSAVGSDVFKYEGREFPATFGNHDRDLASIRRARWNSADKTHLKALLVFYANFVSATSERASLLAKLLKALNRNPRNTVNLIMPPLGCGSANIQTLPRGVNCVVCEAVCVFDQYLEGDRAIRMPLR